MTVHPKDPHRPALLADVESMFQRESMSSTRDRSSLGDSATFDIEELAEASLCQHDAALAKIRSGYGSGLDLEDIYLNWLVPTARLLGHWWSTDRINFAEVTLGIISLQQILYEFSPQFLQGSDRKFNGYRAILFSTPGSQHSFGSFMLAEFFRREGWTVSSMSAGSDQEVLWQLSHQRFDVVGFSVCSDRGLDALRMLILEVRRESLNDKVVVMVGGPMIGFDPKLVAGLGADLMGGDARESQFLAYQHVKNARSAV